MIRARHEANGEEMNARARRLLQAREFAKFRSASAAAEQHKWPASTYRSHENGTRGFTVSDAHKYAQAFGVNPEWLYYGRGSMTDNRPSSEALNPTPPPNILGTREPVVFPTRRLPVYGLAMGGMEGALVLDTEPIDQVECLPGLEFVPDAYAVYVIGDSMAPRYRAGETVFVHPGKPPRKGDYVVVQIQHDGDPAIGYVKEFVGYTNGSLVLAQLNPPQEVTFDVKDVRAVHKIVGTRTD